MTPQEIQQLRSRLAATALQHRGMVTANLPGTSNGGEACAMSVQIMLHATFGHDFAGGTGDIKWVPDLTKGLLAAHWKVIDDPHQAQPGDVAVQNGQHDGGKRSGEQERALHGARQARPGAGGRAAGRTQYLGPVRQCAVQSRPGRADPNVQDSQTEE